MQQTEALQIGNGKFMIDKLHEDCGDLQFLREFTTNSIEAVINSNTKVLLWTYDKAYYDYMKVKKLCLIDTGCGMNNEEQREYLNKVFSSGKIQSSQAFYGIGGKIAALPNNKYGIHYRSFKDGKMYECVIGFDETENVYGALRNFGSDEKGEPVDHFAETPIENVDENIIPIIIKGNGYIGTMVTFYGNSENEDTYKDNDINNSAWVAKYLNDRFYSIPDSVTIKCTEVDGKKNVNGGRTLKGRKKWYTENSIVYEMENKKRVYRTELDERLTAINTTEGKVYKTDDGTIYTGKRHCKVLNDTNFGTASFDDFSVDWFYLNDTRGGWHRTNHNCGGIAVQYKNELYEYYVPQIRSKYHAFGIHFHLERFAIVITPNPNKFVITTDTARTKIRINGSPIPWDKWGDIFQQNMPARLTEIITDITSKVETHDSAKSKDILKDSLHLYNMASVKKSTNGDRAFNNDNNADNDVRDRGTNNNTSYDDTENTNRKRRGVKTTKPDTGSGTGGKITNFFPDITIRWVSDKNDTRSGQYNRTAGEFIPNTSEIILNEDFILVSNLIQYWTEKYIPIKGEAVKEFIRLKIMALLETHFYETVIAALALIYHGYSFGDVQKLVDEDGLTSAILARRNIDHKIKQVVGSKLGSLPDAIELQS